MSAVSFDIDDADRKLVDQIVDRYAALYQKSMRAKLSKDARLHQRMNLVAAHANGNPMDFAKLLATEDFTFAHDLGGIDRHIDRETGRIMNHFRPRCSRADPHPFDNQVGA